MDIKFNQLHEIILVDDFLPPALLRDAQEYRFEESDLHIDCDAYIQRERTQFTHAGVENYLAQFMQNPAVQDGVRAWCDLSWRAVSSSCLTHHEQFVSKYEPGQCFFWHVDHTHSKRYLTFMLPLNEPGGGELLFHRKGFPTAGAPLDYDPPKCAVLPPKTNRLLILPAWIPHRSLPAAATRYLFHGHFNVDN